MGRIAYKHAFPIIIVPKADHNELFGFILDGAVHGVGGVQVREEIGHWEVVLFKRTNN